MEDNNLVNEPTIPYEKPLDFQQVWRMFQETDRMLTEKFKETDRQFKETDRQLKITERQLKESDRRLRELDRLFTSQWGKLIESLVEGDLIKLLRQRNIEVESVVPRRKGSKSGQSYEFDLIAINSTELVIVEVKTTLKPQDIKDFLKKLKNAKTFMPEYKNWIVYGAVAFLTADGSSEKWRRIRDCLLLKPLETAPQ